MTAGTAEIRELSMNEVDSVSGAAPIVLDMGWCAFAFGVDNNRLVLVGGVGGHVGGIAINLPPK